MNSSYFQYIEDLSKKLAENNFDAVDFVKSNCTVMPTTLENYLAIFGETYIYGGGQSRVELHGGANAVRTLGLALLSRAVLAPAPAMLIRLDEESEIDLIYLEPLKGQLDFYDCVPKILEYKFCAELDEYSREGMVVRDADRPSFHCLSAKFRNDRVECLIREIPESVENVLIIDGTANSALRLGAMLLDLTHPSRPGGGLMHLQRRFDQVCAMTYSIDLELRLTD